MLAWHVGLRYLRRRRAAWLALSAVALTVAVPVAVLGVMQGWIDVTVRQVRAAESDLTLGDQASLIPEHCRMSEGRTLDQALAAVPGVAGVAPFIKGEAVLAPLGPWSDEGRGRHNIGLRFEGISWQAEVALGRIDASYLHAQPVTDLHAPPLGPDERGSGFITRACRAHLALAGLEALSGLACAPLPGVPREQPFRSGIVLGRELIYYHGQKKGPLALGRQVKLAIPDTKGGLVGQVTAEVSDTMSTGVYEIDRWTGFLPLPLAQRLTCMDGRHPKSAGVGEINGYRIMLSEPSQAAAVKERIERTVGGPVFHWMDLRGHLVKNLRVQRNIIVFVMVLIQLLCVFIVYAVFSTLVAEKRHDVGVLLGIGAPRRSIMAAFLLAGLAACLAGGGLGWALGWGVLAVLNPVCERLGIPLFPQDIIYTPQTPISFDPGLPLFFLGVSALVGLVATALPAWRAGRIDPVVTLRENG